MKKLCFDLKKQSLHAADLRQHGNARGWVWGSRSKGGKGSKEGGKGGEGAKEGGKAQEAANARKRIKAADARKKEALRQKEEAAADARAANAREAERTAKAKQRAARRNAENAAKDLRDAKKQADERFAKDQRGRVHPRPASEQSTRYKDRKKREKLTPAELERMTQGLSRTTAQARAAKESEHMSVEDRNRRADA